MWSACIVNVMSLAGRSEGRVQGSTRNQDTQSQADQEQGDDESVASLVQTIMTSRTEQKLLSMTKRTLHGRVLGLNDQVAQEAVQAIKKLIARVSNCEESKIIVNWGDARPMRDEVEMLEDGNMLVSPALMNKVAIEVQQITAESASQTSQGKPYLKLTGGGKRRRALSSPLIKQFERAWLETKERGVEASSAEKVLKCLEKLTEFAATHEEDVLAMV